QQQQQQQLLVQRQEPGVTGERQGASEHLTFCLLRAHKDQGLLEETIIGSAALGVPGAPGGPLAEAALSLLLHEGPPEDLLPASRAPGGAPCEASSAEGPQGAPQRAPWGPPGGQVLGRLLLAVELIPERGPPGGPPSWAAAVAELPQGVFLCRWGPPNETGGPPNTAGGPPNTAGGPPGAQEGEWVTWEALCAALRDKGPPGALTVVKKAVRGPPGALVLARPLLTLGALYRLAEKLRPFLPALLLGMWQQQQQQQGGGPQQQQQQQQNREQFGFGLLQWSEFQSLLLRVMDSGAASAPSSEEPPTAVFSSSSSSSSSNSSLTAEEWLLLHGCLAFRHLWKTAAGTAELFDLWAAARCMHACLLLGPPEGAPCRAAAAPAAATAAAAATPQGTSSQLSPALKELLDVIGGPPDAGCNTVYPAAAAAAAAAADRVRWAPAAEGPGHLLAAGGPPSSDHFKIKLIVEGARGLRRWGGLLPSTFVTAAISFAPSVAACLAALPCCTQGAPQGAPLGAPPGAPHEPFQGAPWGGPQAFVQGGSQAFVQGGRLGSPQEAFQGASQGKKQGHLGAPGGPPGGPLESLLYAEQDSSPVVFRSRSPSWGWSTLLRGPPLAQICSAVAAAAAAIEGAPGAPAASMPGAALLCAAAASLREALGSEAQGATPCFRDPAAAAAAAGAAAAAAATAAALAPVLAVRLTVWLLDVRPEGPQGALPPLPGALSFPVLLQQLPRCMQWMGGPPQQSAGGPPVRSLPRGWYPLGHALVPLGGPPSGPGGAPFYLRPYALQAEGLEACPRGGGGGGGAAAAAEVAAEAPCGVCTAGAFIELADSCGAPGAPHEAPGAPKGAPGAPYEASGGPQS
ncbi:hypothetical protein, conserved, partial [Eimeria tenella]